MPTSSDGSSRTRLLLFAIVGAVVVGYLLLSSGTPDDPASDPAKPTTAAETTPAQDPSGGSEPTIVPGSDTRSPDGFVDETAAEQADPGDEAVANRGAGRDEAEAQSLEAARAAIRATPDAQATEEFRARVAGPPPPTPDWVVQAIEEGPPPTPDEISDQIALGKPEVPAEMQEAIERAVTEGPPPTPLELQQAIEDASR